LRHAWDDWRSSGKLLIPLAAAQAAKGAPF
jgi:hypothetical protein